VDRIGSAYHGGAWAYNPHLAAISPCFFQALGHGTLVANGRYCGGSDEVTQEDVMGRGILLWLLGIPLPIILLIWVFGGLHG
jgi:hypothetical protein